MKRKIGVLLACSLLLSGCWDEQLYKEIAIVPLIGIGGKPGDVKGEFAFPTFQDGTIDYSTSSGSGLSLREARINANHETMEGLDISGLQVVLVAEETAKHDLYNYIDMLYRFPRNRLGANIAIVHGDLESYFKPSDNQKNDISTYFAELIETGSRNSFSPKIDIQQSATILFGKDMSLSLPYIKIDEKSGLPEIAGTALFKHNVFTGDILDKKESVILNILKKTLGKFTRFTYMWDDKEEKSPISVQVINVHKKWDIKNDRIDATYKLKLSVEEFPYGHLNHETLVKELDDFLSKELTKDFNKTIKKLQKAKSDAVGFGRPVRAFHPSLWNKGDWNDTFSELPINVKVKAKITRTGILN